METNTTNINQLIIDLKYDKYQNIIVLTGAGISVAAGIPDFRSPGTGLYDNLQKYNLPTPTAVFQLDYFRKNPKPFYLLAKELYPDNYHPTSAHFFIKLLDSKGLLLRNYTQNIDGLERKATITADKIVEAHGTFNTNHCIKCGQEHNVNLVKSEIFNDRIPYCFKCKSGLVKPDIIFFGEPLPTKFFDLLKNDLPKCDLMIIMGTSLQVEPFASLVNKIGKNVPRLLINREVPEVLRSDSSNRDFQLLGDIQTKINELVELLNWSDDLKQLSSIIN